MAQIHPAVEPGVGTALAISAGGEQCVKETKLNRLIGIPVVALTIVLLPLMVQGL